MKRQGPQSHNHGIAAPLLFNLYCLKELIMLPFRPLVYAKYTSVPLYNLGQRVKVALV